MKKTAHSLWPGLLAAAVTLLSLSSLSAQAQDYWGDDGGFGAAAMGAGVSSGSTYDGGGGGGSSSLFGTSTFSYGSFDGSYYRYTFDNDEIDDANGFGLALSVPLADSFYIAGSLYGAFPEQADYYRWNVGAGIGIPVINGFDVVMEGGLVYRNFELDGIAGDDIDDFGWYVRPGIRYQIFSPLELAGYFRYDSTGDESTAGFDLRAMLHVTPSVSIVGDVFIADDVNQYGVGVRLSY